MSELYDEYLVNHIGAVKKAYSWLIENFEDIRNEMEDKRFIIEQHDNSKYCQDEYEAYDRYFYGSRSYKVVRDFDYAWLHHIHSNPHHWQYWVLINDDKPEEILEMPYNYVMEMICDWWSFSWNNGNLYEIFDWYEKHKSMKLHEKTRKLVENTLERIKEKLDEKAKEENNRMEESVK